VELVEIIVIAVGLAMDAFAVSIVSGAAYRQLHLRHALRMAAFFGAFQAVMPLVGYLAGYAVRAYIITWDHWVAFGLLAFVGSKMLFEAFEISPKRHNYDPANIAILLTLSVATSIDALAVGITLSLITEMILTAVLIIGVVTFALSYLGTVLGKRFGHLFEWKIEAFGGIVLIAIGVKILLQHLLA
jgi:putative Mn2+ efflux pump MntP